MKAIIYARFSPRRNADLCESCETQLEHSRAYCKLHKHVIVDEYRDDGFSGATDDRPGFQEALVHVCRIHGALIVYSLSRFARSLEHAITTVRHLERYRAQLISLHENIDTTNPAGRFVFHVFAALDQLERERIAERTSEAMLRHQSAGRLMGALPPYGYREGPPKIVTDAAGNTRTIRMLVEDPDEQAAVAEIARLHAEGLSHRTIAHRMDDSIHEPRGQAWCHATIRRILSRLSDSGTPPHQTEG